MEELLERPVTESVIINYVNGEAVGYPGMLAVGYLELDGDADTGRELWTVRLKNIPEDDWADDEWLAADELPDAVLEQLLDIGVKV